MTFPEMAFLDGQMIQHPSVNDQIGFDFQGLRRSFKEDPNHPDSRLVAKFGRIWVYDIALSIYADLKANRIRQAGYQTGRAMQLARKEEENRFQGLWHFSYNTQGDSFIDPRGPAGANAWCLNALYAYALARGDSDLLGWLNPTVRRYLFALQVMDSSDPRCGLIRAGFYNAEDAARGEAMGYRVYAGDPNQRYEHVILEHCADAAGTYRLAFRATQRLVPTETAFLEELVHRHDLLMQGIRRCFWQGDHFVSALDPQGRFYEGTDGSPSLAVDNNTWSAHVYLPYDAELARSAVQFVERQFRVDAPPAQIEDAPEPTRNDLKGLYYFQSSFSDPFVQVGLEHREKMERMLHPEATFGYVLFLLAIAESVPTPQEKERFRRRAEELYRHTIQLLRLYGPAGAPYASANVPSIFSTLHCVTTAASSVITTAILNGAPADDFIGVLPPREFTVAGKPPLHGI